MSDLDVGSLGVGAAVPVTAAVKREEWARDVLLLALRAADADRNRADAERRAGETEPMLIEGSAFDLAGEPTAGDGWRRPVAWSPTLAEEALRLPSSAGKLAGACGE